MSKYFDKKFVSDIGQKIIKPNIDEETKNFIFSNLTAGNFNIIFDKITPEMSLSFTDNDNNSIIHLLLNTNDKLIPEDTKIKLLNIFIKKGAPINTYNKNKLTPLHIAINNGNDKIVKLLLEKGANPNATTINNLLPIHLALKKNVGLCKELIIPKNIGNIEKKEKNELKKALHDEIIDKFDRKYFNMIKKVFEDYTEILNDNEYTSIIDNIISIIKEDDPPSLLSSKIENKIQDYINEISQKYNLIDNSLIDTDNSTNINEFIKKKLDEKYLSHDTKLTTINNNFDSLINNYNTIVDFNQNLIKLTLNYINRIIIYIPIHQNSDNDDQILVIYPENNQNDPANMGRLNVSAFNTDIHGLEFRIRPAPNDVIFRENLNIFQEIDQGRLLDHIDAFSRLDHSILLWSKLRRVFVVLNNLLKINDLINSINILSFTRDSLKNTILNTIKLNQLYKIIFESYKILKITKLIPIINNSNEPESLNYVYRHQSYTFMNLTEAARLHLNPNIERFINVTTNPRTRPDAIKRLLDQTYDIYNIPTKIENNLVFIESIKKRIDTILTDNLKLINQINIDKYFIGFIRQFDLYPIATYPAENAKMDTYINEYFDKHININNVINKIKYKGTNTNIIAYTDVEIFGIDENNINPSEYNKNHNTSKKFKLFRDSEKQLISSFFDIFMHPEDVRFYNYALDEDNKLSATPIDIFNLLDKDDNETKNFILRDDSIINRTVDKDVLYIIRNVNLIEMYNSIINLADKTKVIKPEINLILPKYDLNGFNVELLISELIKNNTNDIVTLLYKAYGMHYSKFVLKNILTKINVNNNFIKNDVININLDKLSGINYEVNRDFAIDESENPDNLQHNYNYNYFSNDESNLCFKNKKTIINTLLKLPTTNYYVKDSDGNTILHYLINLENYELFKSIYNNNVIFSKLKKSPNVFNKTPINIINQKIGYNNKNFYKSNPLDGLIFSEIYSDELFVKLKNNNELSSIIPDNIKTIFDDLYLIFNLDNVSSNIFQGITINDYTSLFSFNKSNLWTLSHLNNIDNISNNTYNFLIKRYDIKNKQISNNEFIKRFYNSIAHVLTLHLTNVFFQILKKLFIENNIVSFDKLTGKKIVSNIGVTSELINSLKDSLFNFDSNYLNQNIGQMIVINLFNVKYDSNIKQAEQYFSLKEILKSKLSLLYQSIESSKNAEFSDNMEKVYDYMNQYFESFNKKLLVFLTNYVKFVELQYNLQKIKELIA